MEPMHSKKETGKGIALLIGGTGFVGTHMKRLLDRRYNVIATGHSDDIRSKKIMNHLVSQARPDIVVNFAAITTVRETFEDPEETYKIGFLGTFNLLTALKSCNFTGRLLNISSSEVYGFPSDHHLPISEKTELHPMSPYAVNKIATEALCYQFAQSEKFEIVTARPFTHIGPGQSDRFAISNFAKQVAEILLGMKESVIRVGNLDSTRDFSDVRDIVRAYSLLLDIGRNGEVYNVCTGKEVRTRILLDKLIEHSNKSIRVEQKKSLTRAIEQKRVCGSCEKLQNETQWKPEIPLSITLFDTLAYWREKIRTCG